jgi:hypothetical protein
MAERVGFEPDFALDTNNLPPFEALQTLDAL